MALSQDEQRMLAEIERRLAADDPGLASCLTTFRRPSPASVLRSPRARIIGSVFTVLLVAMVSLMVYAMIPFRAQHTLRSNTPATAGAPTSTSISTETESQPGRTQLSSTGTTASQAAADRSATSTSTGKSQPKADHAVMPPVDSSP
jgi:cytoskeletal protein RodZ